MPHLPGFSAEKAIYKSNAPSNQFLESRKPNLQTQKIWLPFNCHTRCDIAAAACAATGVGSVACAAAAAACHYYCDH